LCLGSAGLPPLGLSVPLYLGTRVWPSTHSGINSYHGLLQCSLGITSIYSAYTVVPPGRPSSGTQGGLQCRLR